MTRGMEVRLMSGYTCNPRYKAPSPDIMRKLELSRQEAERVETREMRCPVCGFLVQRIPVTQTDIVFVKCRKCKFDGALSPAYFRRMKRYQAYYSRLARADGGKEEAHEQDLYLY